MIPRLEASTDCLEGGYSDEISTRQSSRRVAAEVVGEDEAEDDLQQEAERQTDAREAEDAVTSIGETKDLRVQHLTHGFVSK